MCVFINSGNRAGRGREGLQDGIRWARFTVIMGEGAVGSGGGKTEANTMRGTGQSGGHSGGEGGGPLSSLCP